MRSYDVSLCNCAIKIIVRRSIMISFEMEKLVYLHDCALTMPFCIAAFAMRNNHAVIYAFTSKKTLK